MTLLILLALAFLLLLAVIAVSVVRFSSRRDAEGRLTAPGCMAGCAVAFVLSLLGVAGLAVFGGAALLVSAPTEEFRAELRDAAHEVGEGLHELGQELRENSSELRRELREELESARRSRRARDARPAPEHSTATTPHDAPPTAPQAEPAPTNEAGSAWRARVVVSWPGNSDPRPELLEAFTRSALEPPVDVAVRAHSDETDGARTIATLSAAARVADVKALDALLRTELTRVSELVGLEYSLESVSDDELR